MVILPTNMIKYTSNLIYIPCLQERENWQDISAEEIKSLTNRYRIKKK